MGAGVGAAVCQLLVLGHVSGGGDQWGEFASANNVLMLMLCRFIRMYHDVSLACDISPRSNSQIKCFIKVFVNIHILK